MFLLILLFLLPLSVSASDCILAEKPRARIIYLHGMDIPSKSSQEENIRVILKQVSREYSIEIFLPRSSMICPDHKKKICWMWNSENAEVIEKNKMMLIGKSKKCFKSNAPLIWLGFSNGANYLTQFFQVGPHHLLQSFNTQNGSQTGAKKSPKTIGPVWLPFASHLSDR